MTKPEVVPMPETAEVTKVKETLTTAVKTEKVETKKTAIAISRRSLLDKLRALLKDRFYQIARV